MASELFYKVDERYVTLSEVLSSFEAFLGLLSRKGMRQYLTLWDALGCSEAFILVLNGSERFLKVLRGYPLYWVVLRQFEVF